MHAYILDDAERLARSVESDFSPMHLGFHNELQISCNVPYCDVYLSVAA